ncbi:hypothetical protein KC19_8G101100 [Ceratodon purpureus]|uniref:Secreted protein n=1 Tax=Ceratodon purpureus TaxID=3225 RepID=A0A8T0GXA7_CERPU|nr:hypothetical protein KC19_8G101100 [Ceratodon purpureus]
MSLCNWNNLRTPMMICCWMLLQPVHLMVVRTARVTSRSPAGDTLLSVGFPFGFVHTETIFVRYASLFLAPTVREIQIGATSTYKDGVW